MALKKKAAKPSKVAPKKSATITQPRSQQVSKHEHGAQCGPECHGGMGTCDWCGCHVTCLLTQGKTWLAMLVAAVVITVVQMALHGHLLKEQYEATASLWLPVEAMRADYFLLGDVLLGVVFALVFRLAYHGCGVVEGIKLGGLIMLVKAVSGFYVLGSQPIPQEIVLWWVGADVLQGVLAGGLLAWILGGSCADGCCPPKKA